MRKVIHAGRANGCYFWMGSASVGKAGHAKVGIHKINDYPYRHQRPLRSHLLSLFSELKRRNVLRVAAAYLTASWLLIQVADTVFPVFGLGTGALNVLITVLAIGFPLFLLFSWVFELTPEGLRRENQVDRTASVTRSTGKQLDRIRMLVTANLYIGLFISAIAASGRYWP